MPMDDKTQVLLEEWKEIRESLRYFGNKRFAQLTVFIAASGFMFENFLRNAHSAGSAFLPVVGVAVGALFVAMELSSVRYWTEFANRGKKIEQDIGYLELMTHYRPKQRIFSATNATYVIYVGVVLLWVLAFWSSQSAIS